MCQKLADRKQREHEAMQRRSGTANVSASELASKTGGKIKIVKEESHGD